MSFTDFDIDNFIAQEARQSTVALADAQEVNPDEASRARELAEATGADPVLVLSNLKDFERQHKLGLGVSIVEENQFIANYLRSNQLAAKISSDDLGQLDATSASLRKFRKFDVTKSVVDAFNAGFDWEGRSKELEKLDKALPFPKEWIPALPGGPLAVGALVATDAIRAGTGLMFGAAAAITENLKAAGMPEAEANRLMRDLVILPQVVMPELVHGIGAVSSRAVTHSPWIREGKAPPVGVDPIFDTLRSEQTKIDIDNLAEAVAEAAKSATRDRSPDMFADFVREHNDGDVYVSADKVRELYGDKPPTPDDNILGWVPRLREQLEVAQATGGDIAIPVADLMARIDKGVFNEIKDHLRTREGGVTIEEAKQPFIEVYHGTPADFDKFDSEFMGSGEGAQAYGHGHYLAENQAVADEYRKNITHNKFLETVKDLYGEESTPDEGLEALKGWDKWSPKEKALLDALEKDDWLGFDYPHQAVRAALKEPQNFEMSPETQVALKEFGNLYKAKIKRAPEEFVDWDASYKDQPEPVKAALTKIGFEPGKLVDTLTGRDIYYLLAEEVNDLEKGKVTSATMAERGIAGIKYKDQGSRGPQPDQIEVKKNNIEFTKKQLQQIEARGGQGEDMYQALKEGLKAQEEELHRYQNPTHNYVVFRDSDIEITHRNDQPVAQAVEQMRKAGGFTPAQGDKQYTLKPAEGNIYATKKARGVHTLDIEDAAGEFHGSLTIAEEADGKRLFVDNIDAVEGANTLGPKAIRNLLEQIKEMFPNAEAIEGIRVSGAREKAEQVAGKERSSDELKASVDLTKIKPRHKPEQLELPQDGTTRMEDREAFEKGAAIGMTADQYKRYQKLIEKQVAEDQAYYTKKAVEEAKRRQTAEWKANEAAIRQEVAIEFRTRPDILADEFFREGKLYDQTLTKRPKIAEEYLTDEQKAALPKSYYGKTGLAPDDAATLLGYRTGTDLITDMARFNAERTAAHMRPIDYTRRLVAQEVDRRMTERYGSLNENIIEEAKERVLSETQIEMLHEETLARAMEAGLEFSIKKDQLVTAIKERFADVTVKEAKSDKFFADAGRANKAAEIALLKGDYTEAFRQKQRAYIATVMARESFGLETAKAKLDKTADRFAKREVKAIEQESVNYIQKLLNEAGYRTKLTPDEIAQAVEFEGTGSLADYVVAKQELGWEPAVTDALQDLGAKPIEQMTAAEFYDFKDAIDSLVYIGREEKKINIAGEKADFDEFKAKVVENLKTLPPRKREKQGRWFFELDASLTNMEQIVKDLDLRQELGPMYRAVIEPMMASKAKEFDLRQDLATYFRTIRSDFGHKWERSLKDTIPNDFIIDPYTGTPYDMTRENLVQIMLNWGNASNIEKFSRGYASLELGRKATKEEAAVFAARTKALIDAHATKQDWDFVTQMWHPFKKWQSMSDVVARNTSGVAPKWIDPQPVQTPFGEIEGGYWPVKYDRLGSNLAVVEDKKPSADSLFGPNYFRAATAKGYLKERTGYIDAVDLNTSLEQAAGVMQQTMHDIAFRDSLMQAGKVFYDKDIRAAIRKHYGSEYEAQMIPWLKRIANSNVADERAIKFYNDWQRRVRTNLIGHALPLNLKVILSPDVGVPNPKQWAAFEANRSANVKFAMEHSNEIRHLVYNMDRDYRAQLEKLSIHPGLMTEAQRKAIEWGFKPMMLVSQEFRMATFIDQHAKARARGLSDHEASVVADSFVRERHGAASVVDLPAVMNSSETMKTLTTFYGFFSTMYNWQRQLPGNVRRGEVGKFGVNALGSIITGATFGALLFNKADKDEGWFKRIAKALLLQPLQTVPIVREAANYFIEGYSPRTPTEGLITALSGVITEGRRVWEGKAPKRPIQAAANIIGLTTGLPLAQIGRTGQFYWDVSQGKQRPKNIMEYIRGTIHGEAQPRR